VTTLLALHGFTGSPQSWDFLGGHHAFPRVAPALVGHSGAHASASVIHFEDEVERLATFAPSSRVHLVGYSLGARLALGLALRHPARLQCLTLVSGHPGLSTEPERAARRTSDAAWRELLLSKGLAAFVDAWQAQPLWSSQTQLSAARRQERRCERLSHTALGLADSLRITGLGEMPDYFARLDEIRTPVRLIAGALDGKFSALARSMAERLPHAELEIVEGAGHDLLLERPEFITEMIRRGNKT
jgi:2-succinyl-6-hydroxy-2,4-cyclohexadiene-1-carboxylate synthase